MKAVILAAGEGVRMRPLTLRTPKPLLQVAGRSLLEHIIYALPKDINELVVVIGYLGDQIKNFLGNEYHGLKVQYIWQKEKLGTGHAVRLCEPFLNKEKFLVLYADDIHGKEGLIKMVNRDLALSVAEVEDPRSFGVVTVDKKGRIFGIEEKPEKPKSKIVLTGAMVLDSRIFNYEPTRGHNGEFYMTTMLDQFIREDDVFAEPSSLWIPIGYPEDLKKAEVIINNNSL